MKLLLGTCLFIMFTSKCLIAQDEDSVKIYTLKQITIFGNKYSIDKNEFPVEKDNLSSVLSLGGFSIIRKGVFLAQDVYADGLKRGDYTIVVDGERYHNACPMRMDAPLSRINPIEIKSVEFIKSSANLQSGLGGTIAINKRLPRDDFDFEASVTQSLGKSNETDISLLTEKLNHRISLRYNQGIPYKTGNDKSFKDLYGYKTNSKYQFSEASVYGMVSDWKYSGSIMYSKDISFPYLQMDERKSVVYNASLAFNEYKLYFNYTDHLMNNDLRVSSMFMETKARNLTLGMVSKYFELYYRHWDADNNMRMANGTMPIYNNILPKINLYSGNLFYQVKEDNFNLTGKVGLAYYNIGNKDILNFYNSIYKNARGDRIFTLLGFSVSHNSHFSGKFAFNNQLDLALEVPEAEVLFVTVKRMMGKPYWSGNPKLDQPFRTTLRSSLSASHFSLDLYGSFISNYVYLASALVGMQKYQTFGNVDALIAGTTFRVNYDFIESEVTYTYGENRNTKKPLIEILPLHISTKLTAPEFFNIRFFIKHTYENAQKRVDKSFWEIPTAAWNTIDFGLLWKSSPIVVNVDVQNILNFEYSQNLAYVRDPFSSGMRIIEPGVSVRVNVRYSY